MNTLWAMRIEISLRLSQVNRSNVHNCIRKTGRKQHISWIRVVPAFFWSMSTQWHQPTKGEPTMMSWFIFRSFVLSFFHFVLFFFCDYCNRTHSNINLIISCLLRVTFASDDDDVDQIEWQHEWLLAGVYYSLRFVFFCMNGNFKFHKNTLIFENHALLFTWNSFNRQMGTLIRICARKWNGILSN